MAKGERLPEPAKLYAFRMALDPVVERLRAFCAENDAKLQVTFASTHPTHRIRVELHVVLPLPPLARKETPSHTHLRHGVIPGWAKCGRAIRTATFVEAEPTCSSCRRAKR